VLAVVGLFFLGSFRGAPDAALQRTWSGYPHASGLTQLTSLPMQAQSLISATVASADNRFAATHTAGGWQLQGDGLIARLDRHGTLTLRSPGGRVSLALLGIGRGAHNMQTAAVGALRASHNRAFYASAGLEEEVAAGPLGIEQSFVVGRRQAGSAHELIVSMRLSGTLDAALVGHGVSFIGRLGRTVRLGGLVAVDRSGRRLPATITLRGRILSARVADARARYPVRIDPLFSNSVQLVADCTQLVCAGPLGTGEKGAGWTGFSVALSADAHTVIVGAPHNSGSLGAAWVFSSVNGIWTEQAELEGACQGSCTRSQYGVVPVGTGEVGAGEFGWSAALSANGNTAIVGAPQDNTNISGDPLNPDYVPVGAAWVFTRSNGSWSQQGTKLFADCMSSCGGPNGTGELGFSEFGYSVALSGSGDVALIGGPRDNGSEGAAWLFERSAGAWSQQAELVADCTQSCGGPNGTGESGGGSFGSSVALSADASGALIGAPADNAEAGAAWVFKQSSGAWSQQAKLIANCAGACGGPDGTGEIGPGLLGYSVSLSADGASALLGAPQDNGYEGAAWLYTSHGAGWTQSGEFVADCTGTCTGMLGTGELGAASFGYSAALSSDGTAAIIGAPDDNGYQGAAWIFSQSPGAWTQEDKAVGDCSSSCGGANGTGEIGQGSFGQSVALDSSGNSAVVGSPETDFQSGAAWALAAAPTATAPPIATGSAAVGSTLSCSPGTWTQNPAGYDYQWDSASSAIVGATSSSYVIQSSDAGNTVTCVVQAFNAFGAGPAATSNGVAITSLTPVNTATPSIYGSSAVGSTLTCGAGSWTNNPYDFSYQWSRDGVSIPGATSDAYTIVPIDEGSRLSCTVIAIGVTGNSLPAKSLPVNVRIPHVAGCPAATGRLNAKALGLARLGATSTQVRSAYLHSRDSRSASSDTFCLTPSGVTVGYPSAALLSTLPHAERKSLQHTVIWITTRNPHYAIMGVRVGTSLATAVPILKLNTPVKSGRRLWYLVRAGAVTYLLRAGGGAVEELGIAESPVGASAGSRTALLSSIS
jgi:hypothetical protein